MSAPPYQVCPGCRQPSELQAQYCPGCGCALRTPYPPPGYPATGYPPYQPYAAPPGYVLVPPGGHSPGLTVLFSLLLFGRRKATAPLR